MLMNKNEVKITFLGDLLCEEDTLDTFRTAHGWDFRPVFADIRNFLSRSDYVLANLETPISENDTDLTHERWCFNSPRAFAEAVKDAGVDFVFTANNHCLDRGTDGLRTTLRALDATGLPHTGTFADPDAAARPTIVDVKGFKLALASYTYGTNAFSNHQYLKPDEAFMVNLFQNQELAEPLAKAWSADSHSPDGRRYEEMEKKRWPENLTLPVYERVAPHAAQRAKIKADLARLNALSPDFTVVSMHTGGQYNPAATRWTKELTAFLFSCGADLIAGTHEHTVHGCDFRRLAQNKLATYCLGDMESQHGRTAPPEGKKQFPSYSVAWHLYLVRDTNGKARISRTTFSILKVVMENDSGKIKVVPAYDAWTAERNLMAKEQLASDMRAVAARFTEQSCDTLAPAPEYATDAQGHPSPAASEGGLVIDASIPSGNIIVDAIEGDEVRLRQDMRDSADWFYFAFRVKGAQGRTLKFIFTDPYAEGPLSCRGPAVSKDGGKTWSFAAEDNAGTDTFSYTFAEDESEVWFFHTFQYFPWQWDEFLARHDADRGRLFVTGELCKSRKGRSVPKARFGRIDGQAKYRVFLSSRHHCQEAPATYVIEGFIEKVFAKDELGAWLRENVEFMVVPFVDYDGVIDGDQGGTQAA